MENHNIPPVWDKNSKILILGSFPSVKSRADQFFYAHPQNRFWRMITCLLEENAPTTAKEKTELLQKHHIALWDVIQSCDIRGSGDSTIQNVTPNDLNRITDNAPIKTVFANGAAAYKLYLKYFSNSLSLQVQKLPSTSPANASYSYERLLEEWTIIKKYL